MDDTRGFPLQLRFQDDNTFNLFKKEVKKQTSPLMYQAPSPLPIKHAILPDISVQTDGNETGDGSSSRGKSRKKKEGVTFLIEGEENNQVNGTNEEINKNSNSSIDNGSNNKENNDHSNNITKPNDSRANNDSSSESDNIINPTTTTVPQEQETIAIIPIEQTDIPKDTDNLTIISPDNINNTTKTTTPDIDNPNSKRNRRNSDNIPFFERDDYQPYLKPIKQFQQISYYRNPSEKLQVSLSLTIDYISGYIYVYIYIHVYVVYINEYPRDGKMC